MVQDSESLRDHGRRVADETSLALDGERFHRLVDRLGQLVPELAPQLMSIAEAKARAGHRPAPPGPSRSPESELITPVRSSKVSGRFKVW